MPIDWTRVAEPTEDGYGARVALHRAATRLSPAREALYVPPPPRAAPLIFDGAVAVERCYPSEEIPVHLVDAPLNHPSISTAVELVRCWPSGYRRVQLLIDSLHPLLDTRFAPEAGQIKGAASSFSVEWRFATLAATVEYPLPLAVACVRQAAHQLLRGLGIGSRRSNALVLNGPRDLCAGSGELDGQPVIKVVHSTFALAHQIALENSLLDRLPEGISTIEPSVRRGVPRRLAVLGDSRRLLEKHLKLDSDGEPFVIGFFAWCARLCDGFRDGASRTSADTGTMPPEARRA